MIEIDRTVANIGPIDREAERLALKRLDMLTKPRGSLGRLEEMVARYAAIRRDPGAKAGRCVILLFAADHGIAQAGVSAYPAAVTLEMLRNIGAGGAAISVLTRRFGYELVTTDVGVATDTSGDPFPGVTYRRVAAGTRNFLHECAMTREETVRALEVGIDHARRAAESGATLIGIGDMGIANSTAAAAILAAVTGIAPRMIVGRGTGIDDAGMARKIAAVETALRLHRENLHGGIDLLSAVGGLEIAAMAGACLGSAAARVPSVVDGFIATAAAAAALRIAPQVSEYMFFSHKSAEGGHALALEALGARPLFDLGMRLGEGTGAVLAMNLIESAITLFHQMATFASAGVSEKIG